ncbi:MAG: hypothetical protein QXT05_00845 [Candidatus Bilamarchaeaceae archaeon]
MQSDALQPTPYIAACSSYPYALPYLVWVFRNVKPVHGGASGIRLPT